MDDRPFNVLFLCTGNSCRSIMAESLLAHLGGDRFGAFSAGSRPAGRVNPRAVEALDRRGVAPREMRAKAWDEFALPGAPAMDLVITVCDHAAGEVCPVWPGRPVGAHWGVPDPALFQGGEAETADHFDHVRDMLERRIAALVALPPEALSGPDFRERLSEIADSNPVAATE